MSGFIGFVAALASAIYSSIAGSATRSETASGSKIATLTVNTDGTWQLTTNGAGGTTISPVGAQTWVVPNNAGSGTTRWVKATLASGTSPSGSAVGSVLALSSAQAWNLSAIVSLDSFTCDLTVNIYADSGGTVLLSTGSVTLTVFKG